MAYVTQNEMVKEAFFKIHATQLDARAVKGDAHGPGARSLDCRVGKMHSAVTFLNHTGLKRTGQGETQ